MKAEKKGIVEIIDELRYDWDEEAKTLETYEGLKQYCRVRPYRDKIVGMLDQIHHYDTSLYMIVKAKYYNSDDKEAEATLKDIEEMETEYTTPSFKIFLREECGKLNDIERNESVDSAERHQQEIDALENELFKYVEAITGKIDLIDDHIHHLDKL
jgi:hypothetical protein